jgi:hypothetical protein
MELLKRLKFWIGLGLLVVASGVVLGVWFLPARHENSERSAEWEQVVSEVEGLASGTVSARGQAAKYGEATEWTASERKRLAEAQSGRVLDLSAPIPDPDTGEQRAGLEPGIWKFVYEKAMRALERDIKRSFVKVEAKDLVRMQDFPAWPSEEQVKAETRSYWVQRSILEALASINEDRMTAPNLNEFELTAQPERLLAGSDAKAYQPQSFSCELEAEFSMVPYIIDQLMKCEIPVNITSVQIMRLEDALQKAARSRVVQQKQLVEGDVVGGRAGRRGVGMPAGYGPGVDPGAAAAAAAAAQGAAMAAAFGGGRAPTARARRQAERASRADEEDVTAAEVRHIPTALVQVKISGYANVPRPEESGEAEPESE